MFPLIKSEFNNEQTYQQCLNKDESLITNDVYDNNPIQPSPKRSQLKLSIEGFYEQRRKKVKSDLKI
jgi:hypothetical protein